MVAIGSNRKVKLINQVGPINSMFVEICGGNIYISKPASLAKSSITYAFFSLCQFWFSEFTSSFDTVTL